MDTEYLWEKIFDPLSDFFKKNLLMLLSLLLILIVAVSASLYSHFEKIKRNESMAKLYIQLLPESFNTSPDNLKKIDQFLQQNPQGFYAEIASVLKASILEKENRLPESLHLYEEVMTQLQNPFLRDLVQISIFQISLKITKIGTPEWTTLVSSIQKFSDSANPLNLFATEFLADAYLREGKKEEALKILDTLSENTAAPVPMKMTAKYAAMALR